MRQHAHDLKTRLDRLEDTTGTGTELVSLTVPPDTTLASVRTRLDREFAAAANIKSDRTRTRVRDALDRVHRLLREYTDTPPNGLATYAGVVDDSMTGAVFDDLPAPVPSSRYTCSASFETAPLREIISPQTTHGLLVIERGGAAVGTHRGDAVHPITTIDSQVMGKSKAGGQSAQRFARDRERQKHEFFERVGEIARHEFLGSEPVAGVLLGGTTVTLADFREGGYLGHPLRDRVIGGASVEYASERGLEQLAERGADALLDVERRETRDRLDEFYAGLAGETTVTYGRDDVDRALDFGAVETLLVSAAHPPDAVDGYRCRAEEFGGEAYLVPTDFDRGERFETAFGGIGALLRYPIE